MAKKKEHTVKLTVNECQTLLQTVNATAFEGKHAEGVVTIKEKLTVPIELENK